MKPEQNIGANGESAEQSDAREVCELLAEQTGLLWSVYEAATDPACPPLGLPDLAQFVLVNALHIHELVKGALILMNSGEPYGVVIIARSALEGTFTLAAALHDAGFGHQRIAYELEELARNLKCLLERKAWLPSRKPSPDDCLREAERIRKLYNAPKSALGRDGDRIKKVERIAQIGNQSPFYDDDYRWLCLAVHANQGGILNAGFLARKAMLALCHAAFVTSNALCRGFRINKYDASLQDHQIRMEALMRKPDFLPISRAGCFGDHSGS